MEFTMLSKALGKETNTVLEEAALLTMPLAG